MMLTRRRRPGQRQVVRDRIHRPDMSGWEIALYITVSVIAGLTTAGAITKIVLESWRYCEAGGPGAGLLLLELVPVNAALAVAWWVGIMMAARRFRGRIPDGIVIALAVLGGVLGSLALCWLMMAWLHDPGPLQPTSSGGRSVIEPSCRPGNIPPWWPGWLPI